MNKIGSMTIKDVQVSFQEINKEFQPCYNFKLELNTLLSTQDINLYYNTITCEWYGDKIAYGEWIDCEQEEVEELKQFLFKLDFIVVSESFCRDFYKYIYKHCNDALDFIFMGLIKSGYQLIGTSEDTWIEEYPTLFQTLTWIYGVGSMDLIDIYNDRKYLTL